MEWVVGVPWERVVGVWKGSRITLELGGSSILERMVVTPWNRGSKYNRKGVHRYLGKGSEYLGGSKR